MWPRPTMRTPTPLSGPRPRPAPTTMRARPTSTSEMLRWCPTTASKENFVLIKMMPPSTTRCRHREWPTTRHQPEGDDPDSSTRAQFQAATSGLHKENQFYNFYFSIFWQSPFLSFHSFQKQTTAILQPGTKQTKNFLFDMIWTLVINATFFSLAPFNWFWLI